MKIAIVHPWFLTHGGAEHTANILARLFPQADIFTLLYNERELPEHIRGRRITASHLNWLPWKYRLYRFLMPMYGMLFESLDLRGYDLIISSDSCVAKGVLIDQNARHICYCHSPMRGLWDLRYEFRDLLPAPFRPVYSWVTHSLRMWDFMAAQRVDVFVANSHYVAERIRRYYRRESRVIHPPVELQDGAIATTHEEYYLSVGRITQTKRVDLAVEACNRLGRRLIVVGAGRHEATLRKLAGPTVTFTGRASNEALDQLYRGCRAVLMASNEDFGIVPVEAQGYGRPVIAFGHGGSLETVVGIDDLSPDQEPTGVYFPEQTVESVMEAILRFERDEDRFDPAAIRRHAERFSVPHFCAEFDNLVRGLLQEIEVRRTSRDALAEPVGAFRFERGAAPFLDGYTRD